MVENNTRTLRYPEVGTNVKCLVVKSSFAQATLKILEIEGVPVSADYRATIKGNSIGEEAYVCDKIKTGEIIECCVLSYGDNTIFVSQI